MPRRFLVPALASLLCACASGAPGTGPAATVRLLPARVPGAQGTVELLQSGGVLRIAGTVHGLPAGARHALAVEDADACGAADPPAASAGERLPDLHADATGAATFSFDVRALSLAGPAGVLGRAMVVRARPEGRDGASDAVPGRRLACGIVRPR